MQDAKEACPLLLRSKVLLPSGIHFALRVVNVNAPRAV
ncbi:Hypothetical protein AA314_05183 [Archangium gephyra]|uniref:Uncharacterized protein n=1 Tax=Archangium gephyra TaxID=48 RepID=A0AAC8TF16_9BACT|nr:Hypothetical protein AA314_05183 [Archangium gephyra]